MADAPHPKAPPGRRLTSRSQRLLRRYPPLISVIVALLIAFVVLPSALTLPQANPSTVLEYAPVPPDDEAPPPSTEGSISEVGLGTTSSLTTGSPPKVNTPLPGGTGDLPITKRCVGDPLRQTEDPNSPPCVPFYQGENGGETWQGVTGDEITVLIYTTSVINIPDQYGDEAEESPSTGTYCDVDAPPESDPDCLDQASGTQDHREVRVARAMSKYFNERFQTYGRRVHFWVYYSTGSASPSTRRADAQDNYKTLTPFAVIDRALFGGHNEVYAKALVDRNVMVLGNYTALRAAIYKDNAPFLWSFWPDVEHATQNFVSYLCEKIAPHPTVAHAGPGIVGKQRKYALLYADYEEYPGLKHFAALTKAGVSKCPNGPKIEFVVEGTHPHHSYVIDGDPAATQAAESNIARMIDQGVTTIIWAGGFEVEHSKVAASRSYFPEWIVGSDLMHDYMSNARSQQQDAWQYARIVSNLIRQDRSTDAPCKQAFREGDPHARAVDEFNACAQYVPMFQMFTAVQVAGPDLSPFTIDQGMHAIQRAASNNPFVAACYYDPGDYTCVKDAVEGWWDPDAPDPDGRPDLRGCWRLVRDGLRFLPGAWPGNDRDAFKNPRDPCTSADTIGHINTIA